MKARIMMTRVAAVVAIEAAAILVPRPARAAAPVCGETCMSDCEESCEDVAHVRAL